MPETLYILLSLIVTAVSVAAAGHALLHKHTASSAAAWVFVCLVFPLGGPLLYYIFGTNRVHNRAISLIREDRRRRQSGFTGPLHGGPQRDDPPGVIGDDYIPMAWQEMAHVGEAVTRRPLAGGNDLRILHNGEAAYPAMLAAIAGAGSHIFLSSYIFDPKGVGAEFVEALAAARARGVDVRVLVDGVGGIYTRPCIKKILQARGVRTEWFLRPGLWQPSFSLNLRNHTKLLVVDGRVAFTGGMNIRPQHIVTGNDDPRAIQDIQFRFSGPVIAQLQEAFLEDWGFITGEYAAPQATDTSPQGELLCRTISTGPDYEPGRLTNLLTALISPARDNVRIMTPYFMPPRALMGALQAAALRGVRVDIILPAKNNLPYVHWASRNIVDHLLEFSINIYYQPPPFAHSKLLLIDDYYAHVGSANLDPRSLDLNYERTVEVFGHTPVRELNSFFDAVRDISRPVTVEDFAKRPVWEHLRDSFFWIFKPYL